MTVAQEMSNCLDRKEAFMEIPPWQAEEARQLRWQRFLSSRPVCSRCGEAITELPYLHFEETFLCRDCTQDSMVEWEEC